MKVDLIRKFKWYIVGFILVAIMLSVSLSFCAWDTLSFKAIMNAKGGDFKERPYELGTLEGDDINKNGIADVGDIVIFGKYYQELTQTGEIAEKTPIRWIVVDMTDRQDGQGKQLTLLAEKVMAFGTFTGNWYYMAGGGLEWEGGNSNYFVYQNYSKSIIRSWLNSSYSNPRYDGGTPFSDAEGTEPRFRGFMSEAFSHEEQGYILAKQISDMKGYPKNSSAHRNDLSTGVSDKVWLPSWSEVYGTTTTPLSWRKPAVGERKTMDGGDARFSYFKDTNYATGNTILSGKSTKYASSDYSNYTNIKARGTINNYQNSADGRNVWWWLRSPSPTFDNHVLGVSTDGMGNDPHTNLSHGGVRPAVCLPL